MTEKEFHRQRQMFAIVNNEIVVANKNDERSHIEWIGYEPDLRGYVDKTGIYFYRRGFSAKDEDFEFMKPYLLWLIIFLDLENIPIYQGVVKGEIGERWKGAKKVSSTRSIYIMGHKDE